MIKLYDEQEILRSYVESEVHEAKFEGGYEANIKTARRMLIDGELSLDRIAKFYCYNLIFCHSEFNYI